MPALLALDLNWRQPVLSPGRTVSVPANYGTMGRASFWHWLRSTQIPNPSTTGPFYNALSPTNYRLGVTVVPVTVKVPVQTTPQLNFTPAGTAVSLPGQGGGSNPFAQVWTGLG